jgi:hypothetical protein
VEIVTRSFALAHDHPKVLRLHAIPNGGWRGMREGMKLKAEGVRPGIPDLCLPVARYGHHGLYMELKNAKGKVRPDQWTVMEELHDEGYCVRLCNDPDTALNLIESYLNETP